MILIDSNEKHKLEIAEKLNSLGISTQIMKLDNYCDYLLISDNPEAENIVAIQRKTIAELLSKESSKRGYSSMMDEIRDRIVNEMKSEYKDAWLLVEDGGLRVNLDAKIELKRGRALVETGISVKSYYNFLHSLEYKGISIKTVPSWEYSIWWLFSKHSYIQKHHYPTPSRKYTEAEEVIGALTGIKGIGEKKAMTIYNHYEEHEAFKNIGKVEREVIRALMNLYGISKEKAKDIYEKYNAWRIASQQPMSVDFCIGKFENNMAEETNESNEGNSNFPIEVEHSIVGADSKPETNIEDEIEEYFKMEELEK